MTRRPNSRTSGRRTSRTTRQPTMLPRRTCWMRSATRQAALSRLRSNSNARRLPRPGAGRAARAEADLYEAQSAKRHRFPQGAAAGNARRIAGGAGQRCRPRGPSRSGLRTVHSTALESVRMALSALVQRWCCATVHPASIVAWRKGIHGRSDRRRRHGAEVDKLSATYQTYAGRVSAANWRYGRHRRTRR